jgi:hypothetical protein
MKGVGQVQTWKENTNKWEQTDSIILCGNLPLKTHIRTWNYNLPRVPETPVRIALLPHLHSHVHLHMQDGPCNRIMLLILGPVYMRTYCLTASLMLSSRLSFCTATSMRPTASRESALAVVSIRTVHFWPGICIPAGHRLVEYKLVDKRDPYFPNAQIMKFPQG